MRMEWVPIFPPATYLLRKKRPNRSSSRPNYARHKFSCFGEISNDAGKIFVLTICLNITHLNIIGAPPSSDEDPLTPRPPTRTPTSNSPVHILTWTILTVPDPPQLHTARTHSRQDAQHLPHSPPLPPRSSPAQIPDNIASPHSRILRRLLRRSSPAQIPDNIASPHSRTLRRFLRSPARYLNSATVPFSHFTLPGCNPSPSNNPSRTRHPLLAPPPGRGLHTPPPATRSETNGLRTNTLSKNSSCGHECRCVLCPPPNLCLLSHGPKWCQVNTGVSANFSRVAKKWESTLKTERGQQAFSSWARERLGRRRIAYLRAR